MGKKYVSIHIAGSRGVYPALAGQLRQHIVYSDVIGACPGYLTGLRRIPRAPHKPPPKMKNGD